MNTKFTDKNGNMIFDGQIAKHALPDGTIVTGEVYLHNADTLVMKLPKGYAVWEYDAEPCYDLERVTSMQDIVKIKQDKKAELHAYHKKSISESPDYLILQKNGSVIDAFELKNGSYQKMSVFNTNKIIALKRNFLTVYA